MSKFLLKVSGFLSVPAVVIMLVIAGIDSADRKVAERKAREMKYVNLFMGDSHISFAVNDSLLDGCINMAKRAELTGYSYHKLRAILESGKRIQNVYLGFGYHNIAQSHNSSIENKGTGIIITDYFYLHTWQEKTGMLLTWAIHSPNLFRTVISNGLKNITKDVTTYDGGFENTFMESTAQKERTDRRILRQFFDDSTGDGFAYKNMEYLARMHVLCKAYGVRLILVKTPLHPYYRSKVPARFVQRFTRLTDSLEIEVMDLTRLLDKDSLFSPDGEHVSYEGARVTTSYLGNRLNLLKPANQSHGSEKETD